MPILNYTTKIDAFKTVGEIQSLLAKKGALGVQISFDAEREPEKLFFQIMVNAVPVNYTLPSRAEGVLKIMEKDRSIPGKFKNIHQARRVAWRILKDWVEAQMAIVESGLAELPEVFLSYAVNQDGQTFYEHFKNNQKLLKH